MIGAWFAILALVLVAFAIAAFMLKLPREGFAVFGAVLLALGRESQAQLVRWIALIGSLISFLVTLPLYQGFRLGTPAMQFVEKAPWIPRFNVNYHLGVDGPWPATWSADGERVRFDDGEGQVEVQLDAQGRIDQVRGDLA